jgi:hypothetical protein
MTMRHWIISGAAAAAICVLAAGCKTEPKSTSTPAPALAKTAPIDAPPNDSVDALTRKTEDYSREMSPLITHRSTPQPAPAASSVEWVDPNEIRLGATPVSRTSSPREDRSAAANVAAAMQPADTAAPTPAVQTSTSPQSPAGKSASALTAPPAQPTNRPAPLATAGSDPLEDRLSRRVKDYPRDPSVHLDYQLLEFLKDEPTPQLGALSTLPPEDRELVTAILDGLTNFRNALRADNNMLLSRKVKPMIDMADRLRSQADLTIPTMQLCTRVNGFGSFDPVEPARFVAGIDNAVIVYCEIANFTSNLNDKQLWETRLTWDMTLYAAENSINVWSDKAETVGDFARNRRHDFFVRKAITLPKALSTGRYLLKSTIVDTQSNRVAEATVPLVIAARAGMQPTPELGALPADRTDATRAAIIRTAELQPGR